MIISASYKTDIPTFYGEWFINRLRAGYCMTVNAYNQHNSRIDLARESVDGFVFWTKNIGPFLKYLPEIKSRGYPFVVQHTVNGYPRELEFSVIDARKSIENLKRLAGEYGAKSVVWRYDTILFTSITPVDFHRNNFERLAKSLKGVVDEVVISFAQLYKKTQRNMEWAAKEFEFSWNKDTPPFDQKLIFAQELMEIARSQGIKLAVCAQKEFTVSGIEEAHCVDIHRLESVGACSISAKIKGNRPDCACFMSRDIGEYDTCPHGCVYCYAVQNRELAQVRFKEHDPQGEFLFTPKNYYPKEQIELQQRLF